MPGETETNLFRDYIRARLRLLIDQMHLVKTQQDRKGLNQKILGLKDKPLAIQQAEQAVISSQLTVLMEREEAILLDQDEARSDEFSRKKKLLEYGGHKAWHWVLEELSTMIDEENDADPKHFVTRKGLGKLYADDLLAYLWDELSTESDEWHLRKIRPYYATQKPAQATREGITEFGQRASVPPTLVQGDFREKRIDLTQRGIDLVADTYALTRAEIVVKQQEIESLAVQLKNAYRTRDKGTVARLLLQTAFHSKEVKRLVELVAAKWLALRTVSRHPEEEYREALARGLEALEAIRDPARDERALEAAYRLLLGRQPTPLDEVLPQFSFNPIRGT